MAGKYEFRPDRQGSSLWKKLYMTPLQRARLFKWVLYGAVLVAASVIQDVVMSRFRILDATTDLVPCAIFLICLAEGSETGGLFTLISAFAYLFSGTEYQVDLTNNDWWTAVSKPIDNSNNWQTEEDAAAYDYAKGVISTFVNEVVYYLPAYYNMIALPGEAAEIRTKLVDITNQYLTQMLGGQLDIEEAWPNYVAEYEAAGAAELEQMVNDAIAAARANG